MNGFLCRPAESRINEIVRVDPRQKVTCEEAILAMILNTTYDQYLGHIFEDIVKQYIIDLNIVGKLPFTFERIGRQWGKIPGKQKWAKPMRSMLLH